MSYQDDEEPIDRRDKMNGVWSGDNGEEVLLPMHSQYQDNGCSAGPLLPGNTNTQQGHQAGGTIDCFSLIAGVGAAVVCKSLYDKFSKSHAARSAATVDHRVMHAEHDRHMIALYAVDDIAVPKWQVAIKQGSVEKRHHVVELLHGAGCWHRDMPYMVIQVRFYCLPGGDVLAKPFYFLIERRCYLAIAESGEDLIYPGAFLPGGHLEHLVGGHVKLTTAVLQQ